MNHIEIKNRRLISKEHEDSYSQKVIEEIENYPDIKEFIKEHELTEDDIRKFAFKFAQVIQDHKKCEGCTSLSHCNKPDIAGTQLNLKYDEYIDEVTNKFEYCKYKKNWLATLQNLLYSSCNPEIARNSYNQIIAFAKSSTDNHSNMKTLLAETLKSFNDPTLFKEFHKGYYVISENTNGRVYLQFLMMKSLLSNLKTCYISSPNLFIPLTDKVNSAARDEAIATYETAKNAQVLLIDDLGLEPKSYQIRDFYLVPLLNERRKKGLFTCATSRFTKVELSKLYSPKDKTQASLIEESLNYLFKEIAIVEPEIFIV